MVRYKAVVTALALLISGLTLGQSSMAAQQSGYRTYDSDLSHPSARSSVPPSSQLAPDSVQTSPGTGPLLIAVGRMDHGRMTPVSELPITLSNGSGNLRLITDANGVAQLPARYSCFAGKMHMSAELMNDQFEVQSIEDSQNYQITTDLPCTGTAQILFKSDSDAGQALGIWQIATRARAALNSSIGLSFWRSRITFTWPADGDYYSFGTVHITRGDYWDVVGHEMGHAIYDLGGLGRFGSGEHKIDECYSRTLALSEGWASFFSAWISINPNDPDAKFENMVPRRAPIRIETIPSDVCKGENNEWRVIGFFWDLVDLHQDGETMNESFARLWNILKGSRVSSASEALSKLEKGGIDPQGLRTTWVLNFQTPSPN